MKAKVLLVSRVLPDELILQILSRIPIKSIIKFKSVCKSWYRLLSGNYFTNLYDQISMRNPMMLIEIFDKSRYSRPRLFCVDSLVGVSEIDLDFINDVVKIRGSRNGLLWCSSVPNKGVYYVCNPMTRQYKVLPAISLDTHVRPYYPDGDGRLMGIVCDLINPNSNMTLMGKTVKNGFKCLVYDSETSKWRKFSALQDEYFIHTYIDNDLFRGQIVYMNGSLYTLFEGYHDVLLIDLKSDPESLSYIALPVEVTNVKRNRAYLLEFDGLLSVVQVSDALFTIWVLKDKHLQTWEVIEKLSSRRIRAMVPHIYRICQSGDYMIFATHKKAVIYNWSTKLWTDLFSAREGYSFKLGCMTRAFRSSLASLCD